MIYNLFKKIRRRISSFVLLKIYTSGKATYFSIKEPVPWSEVWQDVMPQLTRFHQRHIPACVAHATVSIMQAEWYRRIGRIINFSPRFLDIISWTDNLNINDGRDPDIVMRLSTTVGCCTENLLPNDTTIPLKEYRDKNLITKAMYDEAAKYRMSNLGLIPETLF